MDDYFNLLQLELDRMDDDTFYNLLLESGLEICPYEEEI